MKVLIAAPISGHKQYSINRWFDWIANQRHKDYEFMLCVNGLNQNRLMSMLRQVEICDIHGQTKRPIIFWNRNKEGVQTSRHHNIVHARETIRRYAVDHGFDKLLFLDTDTIPANLNTIQMLADHNKEAISGLYMYKKTRVPIAVSIESGTNFTFKRLEEAVDNKELLPCAIWGLGCALIDRSAFTRARFEYEDFGHEVGDDYGYCYALDQLGIERWLDPILLCHHLGKKMRNPFMDMKTR